MGKIGNYDYPELKVSDAIESAKKFNDKLKGTTTSPDALASVWGHKSAKSGTFLVKLGNMRRYGLIDGRGQNLYLSSLAQKILIPKKGEYEQAVKEMIFKIDLWKKIYERLGSKDSASDFWVILQEITNVDRTTAHAEAEKISKLYKDAVSYIKDKSDISMQPIPPTDQPPTPEQDQDYHQINFEGIFMKIPKDDESIETARQLLNMLEKKKPKQDTRTKKEKLLGKTHRNP